MERSEKHHLDRRVRSDPAGGKPIWLGIDGPPDNREGLVGDVVVENDDTVLQVFFEDNAARELVVRSFRDMAALAQEHMIPHKPYKPPDG